MLVPEPQIVCVDCDGRCFLLSHPPEDGRWEPGDIVAYRCEDCRDRWDLVLPDDDNDTDNDTGTGTDGSPDRFFV